MAHRTAEELGRNWRRTGKDLENSCDSESDKSILIGLFNQYTFVGLHYSITETITINGEAGTSDTCSSKTPRDFGAHRRILLVEDWVTRLNNSTAMRGISALDNQRLAFNYRPIDTLKVTARQLRDLPKRVEKKIDRCIQDFGAVMPAVVSADGSVYVGAELVAAAQRAGMKDYPVVSVTHLDDHQLRLFRMAYDKLSEGRSFDYEAFRLEFAEISFERPDLDLDSSGWEVPERDYIYGRHRVSELVDLDDCHVDLAAPPVSRIGDIWLLGRHLLTCGDATDPAVLSIAAGGGSFRAVVSDPPYNVKISNNVSGKGRVKHGEFAQASGEMSRETFTAFLASSICAAQPYLVDGALLYLFQDWRHLMELCNAAEACDLTQLNLLVWAKTKASQGSFYRSAHELIGLFKHGKEKHTNNVDLGRHGRSRSNVITMAGPNGFGPGRQKALELHPTSKPVALITDLILDCSAPGERILDPFGGGGTTVIAAEKVDRVASLVEISPSFVDATCRRFEALTGEKAIHRETGLDFSALADARKEQ